MLNKVKKIKFSPNDNYSNLKITNKYFNFLIKNDITN